MSFSRTDKFIELRLDRGCVAVLRILNHEDHQERDDVGAGIRNQLPGVGKPEYGPARSQTTVDTATIANTAGRPDARAV